MTALSRAHALKLLGVVTLLVSMVDGPLLQGQTVISGTYSDTTIPGDISIAAGTSATFIGGASFSGTNATLGSSATLNWNQAGTLAGKVFTLASNAGIVVSAGNSLTLGAATTVSGDLKITSTGAGATIINQGALTHNLNTNGNLYAPTFTNQGTITATTGSLFIGNNTGDVATNAATGTITANGSNANVYLQSLINQGTLVAQNSGSLRFTGTHLTSQLGTVQLSTGGHAYLTGTLNNTGATLNAVTGGVFELLGGIINNGTIAALGFTTSGGTVSNASFTGPVTLASSATGTLTNATNFTGATATFANNSGLVVGAGGTFTINAGSTATGDLKITSSSAGATFINHGSLTHNLNTNGNLYAPTFTNHGTITTTTGSLFIGNNAGDVATNAATGTITANGSNANVYLQSLINQGTLVAQNSGNLRFTGTHLTSQLGTVQLSTSGHAYLTGTLNNTGATLNAVTGGVFELLGGTINNGTIAALGFTTSGGTVSNASFTGPVSLASSATGTLTNATSFNGATAAFANNSGLVVGAGGTFTINSGSTATGDLKITSSGAGASFINHGSLTHNLNTNGNLYAPTFTNHGTITTTTGSLFIGNNAGDVATNAATGTITANGSNANVYLQSLINQGTLVAQNSGNLRFTGTNLTSHLGTVQLSTSGHAYLTGTLNNTGATLNAVTGGVFELLGGTINNGTIAALGFTTSGGSVNNASFTGPVTLASSATGTLVNATSFNGATATFANNSGLVVGAGGTFTIDGASSATGDLKITSSSAGATFINHGTLTHNLNTNGNLYAPTFTNHGAITTTTGSLFIGNNAGDVATNAASGVITANGSNANVYLQSLINQGTLVALNSGSLRFTGTNLTSQLGAVQLSTNGHAYLTGTLNNTGATLNAVTGGAFELLGGTINNGTIAALGFTTSGGTVSNASFTGSVALASSATGTLLNATSFNGAIASFANNSGLVVGAGGTFTIDSGSSASGDLKITSSSAGATFITHGSLTHTLNTNGNLYAPTFTNHGTITTTTGSLFIGNNAGDVATNAATGTIIANGSNANVYLQSLTNQGTLVAQNSGNLRFTGTNVTSQLGTVQLSTSGHAYLTGTLNNTGATLNPVTGGMFELLGGTINNGTIAALGFTTSGGTVSNASFTGPVSLASSATGTLTNATSFNGATATFANNSGLVVGTGGTFTINSGSTATGDLKITSSNTGASVINHGSLTHNLNTNGNLYAPTFTNHGTITTTTGSLFIGNNAGDIATNAATGFITANGSNANIYLQSLVNQGVLVAQNSGNLRFTGTNTTAQLGSVFLSSGGHAYLTGTLNNTGNTLNAVSGGMFELLGGTINNGSVAALGFTTSGGTVSNVTFTGQVTLPSSASGVLTNGTNFSGATASFASNAQLTVGAGSTFTINSSSSVTGSIRIYSDSAGTSIVNHGSLTQTSSSSGELYATSFTNHGVITAANGTLYLGSASAAGSTFANTNAGVINVAGGNIQIDTPAGNPIVNQGLINLQSGTLFTNGDLVNGIDGSIIGIGTLSGPLTLAGGTVAPGNSVGTLTLTNSAFNVTAPTDFAVDVSGATADKLLFTNPTAPVNLGTGLLSLSLTLLSAPTAGTTYNLIQIGSGGSGITGTFAGLPTSGSSFNATFGASTYTFAVNYQPNLVSLNFSVIPEPSTYVLMGIGAIAIVWLHRRRRS